MDKIDKDTARAELIEFLEEIDLDTDVSDMSEEDAIDFENMVKKLTRQLVKGRLIINDEMRLVYTPAFSGDVSPITFKHPKGDFITSGDSAKPSATGKRYQLMLARVTGKDANFLAKLDIRDWNVCSTVGSLFFV